MRIAVPLVRLTCLAVAVQCQVAYAGAVSTVTTTYQYSYNADGAPTAVTTQIDSQPATTAYLTWANFTPSASAPSTGTVSAADGNLLGVGPSPGSSGLATQFAYDVRDRLTSCTAAGLPAVSYGYHPTDLMASSTLASGDSLQFYYDNGATSLMVNTLQPSTGSASSFLGPVRYLNDGTEQALMLPRKDTAGVYDPSAQTLVPYSYEPYGAPLAGASPTSGGLSSGGTSYDLSQNPFQFTGEYQDPTCNAYYLRTRWYLPAQQTFLSRDPLDALHRFSYTAGNPVGRVDPSGLKYTGADFSRGIAKAVDKLTPGIWAYIEPVLPVWGQALGSIQLLGLLPSFWHHPTSEGWITFGFLAGSIATEMVSEAPFERLSPFRLNPDMAFTARVATDLTLGGSQTAAQSSQHGRVDVPAIIQGIDTTLFGIFYTRFGAGIGYRPHNLAADDVDEMALGFLPAANSDPGPLNDRALVYLVRQKTRRDYTTPWMEAHTIGHYHEYVLVLAKHNAMVSELDMYEGDTMEQSGYAVRNLSRGTDYAPSRAAVGGMRPGSRARFIGAFDAGSTGLAMRRMNPLALPTTEQVEEAIRTTGRAPDSTFDRYSRNCHDHAHSVISALQRPRAWK